MKIIDLTQIISTAMPVYPGTEKPIIIDATTIDKDGFAEKCLTFYSHTGTHIDSPGHILSWKHTLDQFSVDKFIGKGIVIDLLNFKSLIIEKNDIESYSDKLKVSDFILFNTGWNNKWGGVEYFSGFPILSKDALKWLCSFNLKGVGIDCISIDPVEDIEMENHRIVLERDMIIIENLCNLEKLVDTQFMFSCLPLRINNSDGSPVRAVGIIL